MTLRRDMAEAIARSSCTAQIVAFIYYSPHPGLKSKKQQAFSATLSCAKHGLLISATY